MPEKIRIDKFLWCIRIFKTRTLATEACDQGRVKLNSISIKPAKPVSTGDLYEIKTPDRKWTIKVTALIDHRVAYDVAIQHYIDLTEEEENLPVLHRRESSFYTGKRMSFTGKPTKKQRRDITGLHDGD